VLKIGYALNGYFGEYPYLTLDERKQIVKTVRQIVGEYKTIVATSSSECK
jgi:dihydrodipicolinate synthase/N-acetylneuraminate lyase